MIERGNFQRVLYEWGCGTVYHCDIPTSNNIRRCSKDTKNRCGIVVGGYQGQEQLLPSIHILGGRSSRGGTRPPLIILVEEIPLNIT